MGRSLQHSFPKGFHPLRGAIRRERPANQPAFRPATNLNHFYPVAERGDSRTNPARRDLARSSRNAQSICGYTKSVPYKKRGDTPSQLKFLKVLRKLLSRSFLSGFGQSPRTSSHLTPPSPTSQDSAGGQCRNRGRKPPRKRSSEPQASKRITAREQNTRANG